MKKILSMLLVISIFFGVAPISSMAEDEPISPAISVMHNIAAKYAQNGLCQDANMLWLIPDMATYSELFPESENVIQPEEKQLCIDKIIQGVEDSNAPGNLAKAIIALRSLGYDAKKVFTKELDEIDLVSRLTGLVDSGASSVTSVYTLPYVLIALQQGTDYATEEQIAFLTETLVGAKASWQDTTWGPDTATPAILALAPYYNSNDDVKAAIDETIPIITNLQEDSGLIGNAASTGLAIAAFSAIGTDSEEIIKNENTLIDGLMSQSTETLDGFLPMTNSFSTEQGFRGLLGWQLLKNDISKRVYDFKSYPMEEAYETRNIHCPVAFSVTPEDCEISIEGFVADSDGRFNLPQGDYSYNISKSGYKTATGSITITADDVTAGEEKLVSVTLEKLSSGGGTVGISKLRIKVDVMIHGDDCEGGYTYKNNSSEYTSLASATIMAENGDTVLDALIEALDSENIDYVETDGYVSQIGDLAEFDHGSRSGWMFTINGKHQDTGCRETKLTRNSTIIWYYTDDYTKERGSEEYSDDDGGYVGNFTPKFGLSEKNDDITYREIVNPKKTFYDISSHPAKAEIEALAERGIINGKTDTAYEPDSTMTRAEFATIVVGALGLPEKTFANFEDVTDKDWFYTYINSAHFYGIVSGVSNGLYNPAGTITREEAATMVTRAAKLAGMDTDINILSAKNTLAQFTDYMEISPWAFPSLGFCYKSGILDQSPVEIKPKETVSRAEVATMLYNMLKGAKLI